MAWVNVRFTVSADLAEPLSEALTQQGALSVGIDDAAAGTANEQAIFGEPGVPEGALWPACRVTALLSSDCDPADIARAAATAVGLAVPPPHEVEAVQEADWVRLTQAQFDPIAISDRLWIVPTWHQPPNADAVNITLDPGVAFGTGSHPTTRLCLAWLEENIQGGESVLDYGCGSGILAIAAAKLGASDVVGIDIDAQAVIAARNNAALNGVAARFDLPQRASPFSAHITLANILARPLQLLAPLLAKFTFPHGRIAISGILNSQAQEVMACYQPWFTMAIYKEDSGWVCLEGRRQPP